jgi:hypothetical protein
MCLYGPQTLNASLEQLRRGGLRSSITQMGDSDAVAVSFPVGWREELLA